MLTLVSHNAFWFQGVPYDNTNPVGVRESVFHPLVKLYRDLSPDMLCLQEVHEQAVAQRIADMLGMSFHHSPGHRERAYGGAVFWRKDTRAQVWDSRTDNTLAPYRNWQRIIWRTNGQTVHLTNLHLPSSRSVPDPAEINAIQRGELVRFLMTEDFLSDLVVGDFNTCPDTPAMRVLHESGYHDVASLCGQTNSATALAGHRIDYVWVCDDLRQKVKSYRVVELEDPCHQPTDKHKTRLSDHQPLVVQWLTK